MLWIKADAMTAMNAEADRKYPKETGGVLMGYRADNGDYVILNISGPGPEAKHGRFRFSPDHGWQCKELDKVFSETNGVSAYLGDWHTHPGGTSVMSLVDQRTLLKIANHKKARINAPIMIIGAGTHSAWSWKVHSLVRPAWFGLIAELQSFEINVYL